MLEAYNVLLAVGPHSNPRAAPKISDPRAAHATTHGRPLNNPRADRPSLVGPWVPSLRVDERDEMGCDDETVDEAR